VLVTLRLEARQNMPTWVLRQMSGARKVAPRRRDDDLAR
jgi:hypothetical protein